MPLQYFCAASRRPGLARCFVPRPALHFLAVGGLWKWPQRGGGAHYLWRAFGGLPTLWMLVSEAPPWPRRALQRPRLSWEACRLAAHGGSPAPRPACCRGRRQVGDLPRLAGLVLFWMQVCLFHPCSAGSGIQRSRALLHALFPLWVADTVPSAMPREEKKNILKNQKQKIRKK